MLVRTDKHIAEERREAIAAYEAWLQEPDDERVNIWSLTEPDPHADVAWCQRALDRFAGWEGTLPRLRIVWAGTLFVTVEGQQRLQYTLPCVAEAQVKVVRLPVLKDGEPVMLADGTPATDDWELPFDERQWEPRFRDAKDAVVLVKDYIIERATALYVIQELVPGHHAAKERDDELMDRSGGLYQFFAWISDDGTDAGEYRLPVQADVDEAERCWAARLRDIPHRPDEDTPAWFSRQRVRARMKAMKAARAERQEQEREASRDRLMKRLVDKCDLPLPRTWSIPSATGKDN